MSSSDRGVPHFRTLDRPEIDVVLRRNQVGRIAYSHHDRVDVQPIHYAYDGEWIYGRTSPGQKLATLAHSRWVAFEVDEEAGTFDWRSVVAHGSFHVIDPEGTAREQEAWSRALELLRTIVPETMTDGDPAAFRTTLFRIHVAEVTGRAAVSGRE